jgi:hypothetical protein
MCDLFFQPLSKPLPCKERGFNSCSPPLVKATVYTQILAECIYPASELIPWLAGYRFSVKIFDLCVHRSLPLQGRGWGLGLRESCTRRYHRTRHK